MTDLLFVSMGLQWLVILFLAIAVLALGRQIGVLHTRLAPAGALMTSAGPTVGEQSPVITVDDIRGQSLTFGEPGATAQLILFVSPSCPVCKSLIPAARSLARGERRRLALSFASDGGEAAQHERYIAEMGLEKYPYIVSLELGMKFEVGKLPYAVLIDGQGILRSRGLINSREHLESLLESMDSGHASIQDYLISEGQLQKEAS